MSKKLVNMLIKKLKEVKETSNTVSLDFSNNKSELFNDLLIPFMNLTKSKSLIELHEKVKELINGKEDSDNFKSISSALVAYIIDDNDDAKSDIYDEFNTVLLNCMAVYNSLTAAITEKTIDKLSEELIEYINSQNIKTEEVDKTSEQEIETVPKTTDVNQAIDESIIKIIDSIKETDDTPQGDVNKIELKNTLKKQLDDVAEKDKDTVKAVIDETFGIISSYEKTSDQKQPHHILKGDSLILNINGLKAAALFLLKPNSSKNLTQDEKQTIAKHLIKHYDELKIEKPDKLTKISEKNESIITINVKEEELKECAEISKSSIENVAINIGLLESLITDLFNSGIIDISNKNEDEDKSMLSVKLSKEQLDEYLKYFDILSDDVYNIISNNLSDLSYKKTNKDIEDKYKQAEELVTSLKQKLIETNEIIETQKTELSKTNENKYDKEFIDNKFISIINFIRSADSADSSLLQFINNIIEAETNRDIEYLYKLGKSFIKSNNSNGNQFVKKNKVVKSMNDEEIDTLLGISPINKKDKSESVNVTRVENLVDEYL